MISAMGKILAEQDERLQLTRLVDAQQRFVRRWKPAEPYDQEEFERELCYLIHLIYREAQAPLTKQLVEFASLHPQPFGVAKGAPP